MPPTGSRLAVPAAVGAKVTLTVQEPPAAMEVPQVLVSLNGPLALTEETEAAAAARVGHRYRLRGAGGPGERAGERQARRRRRQGAAVGRPPPGKTSNSDSWAASQPVLPVKLSSTYWSLVPDGRLIVTVLPVDGLKVYPAEPTSWL